MARRRGPGRPKGSKNKPKFGLLTPSSGALDRAGLKRLIQETVSKTLAGLRIEVHVIAPKPRGRRPQS